MERGLWFYTNMWSRESIGDGQHRSSCTQALPRKGLGCGALRSVLKLSGRPARLSLLALCARLCVRVGNRELLRLHDQHTRPSVSLSTALHSYKRLFRA